MSRTAAWPLLICAWLCAPACVAGPHPRTQHVVNGETVSSSPPSPNEYAAYLRVRLALETPGGDLKQARHDLTVLLAREPNDPQLWVTKAELELLSGDATAADAALVRAFELEADYAPALALRDQITRGPTGSGAAHSGS